jgi:hypothetical protein
MLNFLVIVLCRILVCANVSDEYKPYHLHHQCWSQRWWTVDGQSATRRQQPRSPTYTLASLRKPKFYITKTMMHTILCIISHVTFLGFRQLRWKLDHSTTVHPSANTIITQFTLGVYWKQAKLVQGHIDYDVQHYWKPICINYGSDPM